MMPLDALFQLVAEMVCVTHVAAAIVGFLHVAQAKPGEKPLSVSAASLTEAQREALSVSLARVLAQEKAQNLLFGDIHDDLRLLAFLADPRTIGTLADAGVRRIFLEVRLSDQKRFDAVAAGKTNKVATWDTHYAAGKEAGAEIDKLEVALIRNASQRGMKVIAGDANDSLWADVLTYHSFATMVEGIVLEKLGLNKLARFVAHNLGFNLFARVRCNEKRVARLIDKRTNNGGRNIVFRGQAHLVTAGKTSLRACLRDTAAFVFTDPCGDASIRSVEAILNASRDVVPAVRSPDYEINLGTNTIAPVVPRGGPEGAALKL
jgi:hypothetical protein